MKEKLLRPGAEFWSTKKLENLYMNDVDDLPINMYIINIYILYIIYMWVYM